MTSQQKKYESFKKLHEGDAAFVIPNPWNAGSARILTSLGYKALATTSAGYAFDHGIRDASGGLSRDEILANAKTIMAASELPVSADLEDGFGREPDACADTISAAIASGLVGGSIEDATGDESAPIFDFSLSVERVAAACDAARNQPFMVTARAENHCYGCDDLGDTIRRLQAFSEAGADVLYAPGLPDLDAIRTVCAEVDKPVNVVMGLQGALFTVDELSAAGVKRISVGGSFARAAYGAMIRAATEVLHDGHFHYANSAISDGDIRKLMAEVNHRGT